MKGQIFAWQSVVGPNVSGPHELFKGDKFPTCLPAFSTFPMTLLLKKHMHISLINRVISILHMAPTFG